MRYVATGYRVIGIAINRTLFVGLVLNILITSMAVIIAPYIPTSQSDFISRDRTYNWAQRKNGLLRTINVDKFPGYLSNGSGAGWKRKLPYLNATKAISKCETRDLPNWAELSNARKTANASNKVYSQYFGELGFGWPAVCISSAWALGYKNYQLDIEYGLEQQYLGGKVPGLSESVFPLHIVWKGVIINTIFWALVGNGVMFIHYRMRKFRRVRSGNCPLCGYDIRGDFTSGCPECGWKRNDKDKEIESVKPSA